MQNALFDALGFTWDRSKVPSTVPVHSVERACFHFYKMLPEFVWDAAVLEGLPLTFIEIKTLLDGVIIGDKRVYEQERVLDLARGYRRLLEMVKAGEFALSKPVFLELHSIFDRNEAWSCSALRGADEETLNATLFECAPLERAVAVYMFATRNERVARSLLNGILMSHGIDAISVPAARVHEFNEKMARFLRSRDATEAMDFLLGCHPDLS
jgi:hypothetical protein